MILGFELYAHLAQWVSSILLVSQFGNIKMKRKVELGCIIKDWRELGLVLKLRPTIIRKTNIRLNCWCEFPRFILFGHVFEVRNFFIFEA